MHSAHGGTLVADLRRDAAHAQNTCAHAHVRQHTRAGTRTHAPAAPSSSAMASANTMAVARPARGARGVLSWCITAARGFCKCWRADSTHCRQCWNGTMRQSPNAASGEKRLPAAVALSGRHQPREHSALSTYTTCTHLLHPLPPVLEHRVSSYVARRW